MAGVTIVGAGLAGLSCALYCARAGVPCTLVSALPSERAQSVLAEGGINAALDLMGEGDSVAEHVADTLRGGCGLADPAAVADLCAAAPGIVAELVALGVPFQVEGGRMVQRHFGGQRRARTAYVRSSTGKALVTALVDAVRRFEGGLVTRLPRHVLVDLDVAGGRCRGCLVQDAHTGAMLRLPAPVVLATGGYGGLFGACTTGSAANVGDAQALCLARGVALANLEFVQYHPTTAAIAGKRLLISEAARGEGGRLFTLRGGGRWHFMEELHPELGNLAPRDVVSREEAAVLADPACEGVYLDLTGIPARAWRERLADLRDECVRYLGLDPAREPVAVAPGIHYTMGGIWVDRGHRTSVAGLCAAGECACQYHGANRLGGNSLLGALYGGRVAARSAIDARGAAAPGEGGGSSAPGGAAGAASGAAGEGADALPALRTGAEDPPPAALGAKTDRGALAGAPRAVTAADLAADRRMQGLLAGSLGVLRDGPALAAALAGLEELDGPALSDRQRRRLLLARAAVASALARGESRGAHVRADFPEASAALRRTTLVRLGGDGGPDVSFAEVGEGRP